MQKIGLKLWSRNIDFYYKEAKRLYSMGLFDYIELYVVPSTTDTIKLWKDLNIPINLHAPHFDSGVNLAVKEKENYNIKIYGEVKAFYKELKSEYIVFHSGIEGSVDETIRQLNIIKLENALVENKPYLAPTEPDLRCRGAKVEEIQKIMEETGCGFCLDISHAICSANSFKINPYEYLEKFNKLNPKCYHISDNYIDNEIDKHLHFGKGTFDFDKIFALFSDNANIAIETNKNSKENLNDFIEDSNFVKNKLQNLQLKK